MILHGKISIITIIHCVYVILIVYFFLFLISDQNVSLDKGEEKLLKKIAKTASVRPLKSDKGKMCSIPNMTVVNLANRLTIFIRLFFFSIDRHFAVVLIGRQTVPVCLC